jgi:hypothetical protein
MMTMIQSFGIPIIICRPTKIDRRDSGFHDEHRGAVSKKSRSRLQRTTFSDCSIQIIVRQARKKIVPPFLTAELRSKIFGETISQKLKSSQRKRCQKIAKLTMAVMIASNMDQSPELFSPDAESGKVGQKKRQRTRAVTFNAKVRWRETYSADQVQDCWYSNDDYHMFRKEIHQTVQLMKRNVYIDDARYCQRGLEKHLMDAAQARREVKGKALFVVMSLQQDGQGMDDSRLLADRIAQYYTNVARTARMPAYLAGIADESYARRSAATEEAVPSKVAHPRAMGVELPTRTVTRRTVIPEVASFLLRYNFE